VVRSDQPDEVIYIMVYNARSQLRQDWRLQPEGPLFRSQYFNFDAETLVEVNHSTKTYLRVPINERTQQSQQSGWQNAKDWVRQFLSSEYTKLGRRTIESVPCEGIEMTDPTLGGGDPPPTNCVARLWVSVETGYPFRLEYNSTHATTDGNVQVEALFDQFQWNVELSPSLLEPNIPPDYTQRP
jgi:outer membrane lipoprotein-sorting protein